MARTHDTIKQVTALRAEAGQPLIAIPMPDGTVLYFTSEEDANAVRTEQTLQDALDLAGAWSDLADEDVEGELDRLRHESEPSPPFTE